MEPKHSWIGTHFALFSKNDLHEQTIKWRLMVRYRLLDFASGGRNEETESIILDALEHFERVKDASEFLYTQSFLAELLQVGDADIEDAAWNKASDKYDGLNRYEYESTMILSNHY